MMMSTIDLGGGDGLGACPRPVSEVPRAPAARPLPRARARGRRDEGAEEQCEAVRHAGEGWYIAVPREGIGGANEWWTGGRKAGGKG